MDRLTLLGILSAHASANGSHYDKAWTIATGVAASAPADVTEEWLRQACADASDRAAKATWGPVIARDVRTATEA